MLNKIKNEYKLQTIKYKKGSDQNELLATFQYNDNTYLIVLDLTLKGYYGAYIKNDFNYTLSTLDSFELNPPVHANLIGNASNLWKLKSVVREFFRNYK